MDTTALVAIIKWLFPATVGSCLAVYYKAKEIGWEEISKQEKIKTFLLATGAIFTGVFVAYILGGVIVEVWGLDNTTKAVIGIYMIAGLSGVKLVDAAAKNTSSWVDKIVDSITNLIDKFKWK